MSMNASRSIAVVTGLVVCLAGCGGKHEATVRGVLTIDGQPLPDGEQVRASVTFFPSAGGAPAYAIVEPDGAYTVQTGNSRGLKPGEYRVTIDVLEFEPPPPGGYVNAPGFRVLNPPEYRDRETTPIVVRVESGTNEIDLDVETSSPSPG